MRTLTLIFLLFANLALATLTPVGVNGNATSIQGVPISGTAPSGTQCLVYSAGSWAPASCAGSSGISGSWSTTGNLVTTGGTDTAQDSSVALSSIATLTGTQTFTNKTFTSPTINSGTWGGTTVTGQTASNVLATDGSGNLTVFGASSSVSTLTGTQTLTNKTLTSPTINSATWGGTTATGQTASNFLSTDVSGNLTVFGATSSVATLTGSQTLTNKTLTSPTLNGATWGGTTATGQGNSKILETDGSGQLTSVLASTVAASGANSDITSQSGITGSLASPTFIDFVQQGSAPATPASSHDRIYFRTSDGAPVYVNSAGTVNTFGGASGVTTVGAFSGSSQTNGASISSSTITFGPADATNPGMVSTAAQSFAGVKTFAGMVLPGGAAQAVQSGGSNWTQFVGNLYQFGSGSNTDCMYFGGSGNGVRIMDKNCAGPTFQIWSSTTTIPTAYFANTWQFQSGVAYAQNRQSITTGGSYTVPTNTTHKLLLHAAGTIASYTVTMPATPYTGQEIGIMCDITITTFTVSANTAQTIVGAPTTCVPGTTHALFQWDATDTEWVAE